MNETITMPERAEGSTLHPDTLRFSTITFYTDMSKANAPVIPLGIMTEILLPSLHGLGMVARVELSGSELAGLSELPKQILTKPFDYLAIEFNEAWMKAPGGALDYVSAKHAYSALHFGMPQRLLEVPLQFASPSIAPTLKTVVRQFLGSVLDDQMFRLIYGRPSEVANRQEEILQLKAA